MARYRFSLLRDFEKWAELVTKERLVNLRVSQFVVFLWQVLRCKIILESFLAPFYRLVADEELLKDSEALHTERYLVGARRMTSE